MWLVRNLGFHTRVTKRSARSSSKARSSPNTISGSNASGVRLRESRLVRFTRRRRSRSRKTLSSHRIRATRMKTNYSLTTFAFPKDIQVSSCPTLVQIEIKNNVRSVHKEIGSENPPSSRANSPENASQAKTPVDFPEEFESGESASSIAVEESGSSVE